MTTRLGLLPMAVMLPFICGMAGPVLAGNMLEPNGALSVNTGEFVFKDGKLGVHVDTPTVTLHINGQLLVKGEETHLPATGKVLTSTGTDGLAAWMEPVRSGFRNRLINGGMDIWQRGMSFSAGGYAADRWQAEATGNTLGFSAQRVSVSDALPFRYAMSASAAGTNHVGIRQQIEYTNFHDLAGKTVTLSFWVKALYDNTESATVRVWNRQSATEDTPLVSDIYNGTESAGMSISTTGWTRVSSAIDIASDTRALAIGIVLGGANQSSSDATRGFAVTGVQLEELDFAGEFEYRPYQTELQLCQRYYEKSYAPDTAPGSVDAANVFETGAISNGTDTVLALPTVNYKVPKRTSPTLAFYAPAGTSGACAWYSDFSTSQELATSAARSGVNGFMARQTADNTANDHMVCHYTADAEFN